jgi:hypothetical protein
LRAALDRTRDQGTRDQRPVSASFDATVRGGFLRSVPRQRSFTDEEERLLMPVQIQFQSVDNKRRQCVAGSGRRMQSGSLSKHERKSRSYVYGAYRVVHVCGDKVFAREERICIMLTIGSQ